MDCVQITYVVVVYELRWAREANCSPLNFFIIEKIWFLSDCYYWRTWPWRNGRTSDQSNVTCVFIWNAQLEDLWWIFHSFYPCSAYPVYPVFIHLFGQPIIIMNHSVDIYNHRRSRNFRNDIDFVTWIGSPPILKCSKSE